MTTPNEIEEHIAQFTAAIREGQAVLAQARTAVREEVALGVRHLRQEAERLAAEELPPALRQLLLLSGAEAARLAVGGEVAAQIAAGERDPGRLLQLVVGPLDSAVALAPRGLVAAARGAALEGVLRELLRLQFPAEPASTPAEPAA